MEQHPPAVSYPPGRPVRPRPQWYADVAPVRARQLLADLLVALWCLVWVAVGVAVHGAVGALVAPTRDLAGGAGAAADQLERGSESIGRLPLVGDEVAAPLDGAAEAVAGVAEEALRLADLVGDLALALAVLVPLTPVALALLLWLPARLRGARRAGAARALLEAGADSQLFALRALTTQPMTALAQVSADPVGDWRRGDPAVLRSLAALELRGLGVSPELLPPPAARGPAPNEGAVLDRRVPGPAVGRGS